MTQFSQMSEIDLKLNLLSGKEIFVENIPITPFTLDEIRMYGYSNYLKNLQWLTFSIKDFIDATADEEKKEFLESQKDTLKTFDFYIKLGGKDILNSLISSLSMVFKTEDVRVLDDGIIVLDFIKLGVFNIAEDNSLTVNEDVLNSLKDDEIKIINRDNFDNIVNVVKFQNYLDKATSAEKEKNPADEETRKLMEQMARMREKVEAKKKIQKDNDGANIDISDIVSAVSSKSHSINRMNVWDLTLYQLYDEYARLELIDNYDYSIQAMMAGAEKIDLKHWSSKI